MKIEEGTIGEFLEWNGKFFISWKHNCKEKCTLTVFTQNKEDSLSLLKKEIEKTEKAPCEL